MRPIHRILVATDLSKASVPAFREAVGMAKDNGAELLIAHVYRPPNLIEAESVAPGVYQEWDENLRTDVEERLQPWVEDARRQSINVRSLVLPGVPYEAIARAVQENQVDLVVMGTHGRKGASRFFLGSVAARVISTAPCPVMTVRAA
jgi:universal stress protein A